MLVLEYIDIALSQGYKMLQLLQFEIALISFYLEDENCLNWNSQKSSLMREIEVLCNKPPSVRSVDNKGKKCIFIDFISNAKKVPVKKESIKTFKDFLITYGINFYRSLRVATEWIFHSIYIKINHKARWKSR